MKISLNWLSDFVDLTVSDPQEIARRITAGVAEVDDLEIQGALLDHCCVGKVLTIRKHPNADRLSVCEVTTDDGVKNVVCGGTNLREGMRVAFAHVGARVRWHGDEMVTLTRAKIRGEDSSGMICAAEELDLGERFKAKPEDGERPIVDLGNGDDGVGQPLKEYLGLGDVVLHIDNHAITHRADLFSHVGFAREFVALGLGKWKNSRGGSPTRRGNLKIKYTTKPLPFRCIIDRKELVPRYCAVTLEISALGETPKWMRDRLAATGWRSLNLPIDITNYVMMEQGMPLHAFDADDIKGDIHARTADKGEKITTLDGKEFALPKDAVVLSDDAGIFDLLGIMGGLRSSTKDSTRRIYLHAPIPDPSSIRKTVIATGQRTDAATTYEKGVPREAALRGLERAVELFLELVPGAKVVSKLEDVGTEDKTRDIEITLEKAERVLGMEIDPKKAVHALEVLGFAVKVEKGKKLGISNLQSAILKVTVPPHRLGDMRIPEDLVEEIGRVLGYDSIPAAMPVALLKPAEREERTHTLRDALKLLGYTELVPLSLTSKALLKRSGFDPEQAVSIVNPLSEEWAVLHTSTVPSLLEHAQRNILNAGDRLKTFHLAAVFTKGKPEHLELSLLLADLRTANDDVKQEPLLLLKRDVTDALASLGLHIDVSAVKGGGAAHPGRSAELFVHTARKGNEASAPQLRIGTLYEVHPSVSTAFDIRGRAAIATIDVTSLLSLPHQTLVARGVPAFPAVTYDVTHTLSHREQAGPMIRNLRDADPLLESVEVIDLYSGKPHPAGEYSLTLRFTYRADDRTLTEDEAKKAHDKVLKAANL